MKIKEVIEALENLAPKCYAEDFDNVGLQVGDENLEINNVLVTLDVTEAVMEEAIKEKVNLIVTFHPLIFTGLKSLTGKNRVQQLVIKAIQNNIAIYAIHTNLDNQFFGVNHAICQRLALENTQILLPKNNTLFKLAYYVPKEHDDKVKNALFKAGAGEIGNYSECSFNVEGKGTFKPNSNSEPYVGERNMRHIEIENKVEILIDKSRKSKIISVLKENHPYEEVAYEIIPIDNKNQTLGMGQFGQLKQEMSSTEFLEYLKKRLPTQCIRHSNSLKKSIQKVAVLGGSGAFCIEAAKAVGADALVTADLKYHDFFTAENKILLCDIGHYESEQFTKNLLSHYLSEIFSNFAVLTSKVNTNPVNYYF